MSHELATHLRELNVCDAGLGPAGQAILSNFRKVGIINFKGRDVEIRPKVSIAQILSLLDPQLQSFSQLAPETFLSESSDWTNALALFFDLQLKHALARGAIEGYVSITEWSRTLRGRVEFSALATAGRFGAPDILVTHDEFTTNVPENKVLRTAIEVLLSTRELSDARRKSLQNYAQKLDGVELLESRTGLRELKLSDTFRHYEPALKTALLILGGQSIDASIGSVRSSSFLIDMAQLFEFLIDRKFEEFSASSQIEYSSQYGIKHLDVSGIFRIRPDYMFFKDSYPVGLADAKYKIVSTESQVPNSDINQMIAYCSRFNLPEGHLIYAKSPEFAVEMVGGNLRLLVHEIDLASPISEVVEKLHFLWSQITGQDDGRHETKS